MITSTKNFSRYLALFVTLLFLVITTLIALHHEPWFDEAQGWLLARDSGLWELVWHNLRYEGSPGLWHLLLWIPAHLGVGFWIATAISVLLATISTFLLVKYSPFPVWARVLLPFTFYLGYQYAVVARSYVLFPLLLFFIAIRYPERHRRPVLFFILLALLANISAHGILVSCGIALVHLIETIATWRKTGERPNNQTLACYGGFALVILLLAAILWPPADIKVFTGDRTRDWFRAVTWPFTEWGWSSLIIYFVSFVVFFRRRTLLLFFVTWGPVALLFHWVFRYTHDGLLFLIWLFVLWVSMENEKEHSISVSLPSTRRLVTGLLAVVLTFHIVWYGMTVYRDWTRNYSAGHQAAHFLAEHGVPGQRVFGWGFPILSILPYFQGNIFYNYNGGGKQCYWRWKKNNPWNRMTGNKRTDYSPEIREILSEHPEIVVIGIKNRAQAHFSVQLNATQEYQIIAFFHGTLWFKTMPNPQIGGLCIFQRKTP